MTSVMTPVYLISYIAFNCVGGIAYFFDQMALNGLQNLHLKQLDVEDIDFI